MLKKFNKYLERGQLTNHKMQDIEENKKEEEKKEKNKESGGKNHNSEAPS